MSDEIEECIRRRLPADQTVKWHEEAVKDKENVFKRFGSIDINLNDMKNEIGNISKALNEWKDQSQSDADAFKLANATQHKQIMDAIKDVRDNTASKLTEKIVYGAVVLILVAVLSAVIYTVINKVN